MKFIADLHVHSKFSRATAKNLDFENLYIAAQCKGITVLGTGDFTYPQWFSEIKTKLCAAEPGLFKLKDEFAVLCDQRVPASCRGPVRFLLATEISNIYKKDGRTRKNHNLVLAPSLEVAEKFSAKLDKIGNIKSDGRPILGLDARDLLEVLLETSDQACLIPAHIWTPWFSMLGSKSGFDSVEECFEDLTSHIFAVETGLSSDPPMNWRVSGLDDVTLVSNSDAHSPANIGREANYFNTALSYDAIRSAIQSGDPNQFLGTFEFYPEEGKYHLDGHRNCQVRLWPRKTIDHGGICPQCGKALTLGVLYRVEELADREEGQKPQQYHPYYSVIPLLDIFAEIFRVGPKSKKVAHAYATAIQQLGSEFNILHHLQPQFIDEAGIPLLGEAVRRMRNKQIEVLPGYDGEYGQVKIFSAQEREQIIGQQPLFSIPTWAKSSEKKEKKKPQLAEKKSTSKKPGLYSDPEEPNQAKEPGKILDRLNKEQRHAVQHPAGPLLIVAGPGTGKTLTLTHRIAYLIRHQGVSFQNILAVTFTNKAAEEMRLRLQRLLGDASQIPQVATFHALCFKILNDLDPQKEESIIDEEGRKYVIAESLRFLKQKGNPISLKPREIIDRIIAAKQQILGPDEIAQCETDESAGDQFAEVYLTYQQLLAIQGLNDYEDLIFKVVRLFETNTVICKRYRNIFQHLFVDEYQDLNHGQYRIIRALAPPQDLTHDICVIGDPDQSIYGFRGSDFKYFKQFIKDYPRAEVLYLTHNYRSTGTILDASYQVIKTQHPQPSGVRTYSQIDGVKTINIIELANERAEAETIARIIEKQVGGTGFHSIDTGTIDDANLSSARSYSDFVVLYRTNDQHRIIAEVFEKSGIPCQIASRENTLNQESLPEILSFLRVVSGCAGYEDHEKVLLFSIPAIGKKTLSKFKLWCYQKQFSLADGLRQAKRFPIPGLKPSAQQMLNDFSHHLIDAQNKVAGMTVAQKLLYLTRHSNWITLYEDNVASREALDNLVAFSKRFGRNTTDFFSHVALHTDTDAYVSRAEKVSLMTMHTAKGLEFPVVFITGCEQDYIPLQRSTDDVADVEEERRLFYVAMTRAMERLYLSCAKKRRIYGRVESRSISPFVADIEARLKKFESPQKKKKKNKSDQQQLTLF